MTQTRVQVHALFPTPVGSYAGFPGQDLFQQQLQAVLNQSEARSNSQDPRLRHWFDSAGSSVLELQEPWIQELKDWILKCALDFTVRVQGVQCAGLQVMNSWCNSADQGASQPPHSHENSLISGTYYVSFEQGHSPISFWRPGSLGQPNHPYISLAHQAERTSFSADEIQISPASGTLLLWPSHLLHGHSGNARDGRLSLSMNLLPKQLLGSSYGFSLSPLDRSS